MGNDTSMGYADHRFFDGDQYDISWELGTTYAYGTTYAPEDEEPPVAKRTVQPLQNSPSYSKKRPRTLRGRSEGTSFGVR